MEHDITKKKDPGQLHKAVSHGKKGDSIVYWRGPTCGGPFRYEAVKLEKEGLISLVQRRTATGSSIFDYIAQIR